MGNQALHLVLLVLLLALVGRGDPLKYEGGSMRSLRLRGGGGSSDAGSHGQGVGLLSSKGMQFRPLRKEGTREGGSRGTEGDRMEDSASIVSQKPEEKGKMDERYSALWRAVKDRRVDVILDLMDKGLNLSHPDASFGGWTSLHYAAAGGEGHVVDMLLSHGVPVDICNDQMSTPLAIAASEGHLNIVEKLLRRGADVNASNNYGMTALHRAAASGCTKTCALLISTGLDVDSPNVMEVTPLHLAACGGFLDTVETLVGHGADVNQPNSDGWIALHYAALKGNEELIELLLSKRSKVLVPSKLLETPVGLAKKYGHEKSFHMLLKASWEEKDDKQHMDMKQRQRREIDDEYDKFWSKIWQEQVRRHQSSGEGSSTLSDVLDHHKATMMGAEDGIVSWPKRYPGQGVGDDLEDGKKPEIPVTPVPMSFKSSAGTGLEKILPDENGTSCIDYDLLFENPKGEVEKVVFGVTPRDKEKEALDDFYKKHIEPKMSLDELELKVREAQALAMERNKTAQMLQDG